MSDVITLTLRGSGGRRIVADCVTPDRLAALTNPEIAALPIWLAPSNRDAPAAASGGLTVGDAFVVTGARASAVRVIGDAGAVDGLGTGMVDGSLIIDGDVGCEVGRAMRGGMISVSGSAGADVGVGMSGGSITIAGNVGDRVGGAAPGASRGMVGGEIIVRGHAGRDVAQAMRRGLVVIGGDAVDAGRALIAGTVVVAGSISGSAGEWNKRGSIITIGGTSILPTYRYACTYQPPHLALLGCYLRRRGVPIDTRFGTDRFARYCGDMSQLGMGELLVWAGESNAKR
jgi:formylmethanofuran dehydrogenase subunit C